MNTTDILIIGAGAAGMAAGIFAAEAAREAGAPLRIVLLDSARKPGAKILISGGGRCNVTNTRVAPEDYSGGPATIVRKVLRAFDNERTRAWMRELGVELKLEPTGKYFPTSDKARTVLDALMTRLRELGAELHADARVTGVRRAGEGFEVALAHGERWLARRLIMATGGCALPKSGSDGAGIAMARRLGHTVVPLTPALVPIELRDDGTPGGRFAEWSGITLEARLALLDARGKALASVTRSLLFTHFGLSGPAAMDISRHWLRARLEGVEGVQLVLGHPTLERPEDAEAWLLREAGKHARRSVSEALRGLVPERIAAALGEGYTTFAELTREGRAELARRLTRLPLPAVKDRGYAFAETSAGGVDLREVDVRTMQSRVARGLFLCGEMLDCDGRIGGFNFQWAWATGYLAGRGAAGGLVHHGD